MPKRGGIIDNEKNPFSSADWIDQGFGLTIHREKQLKDILGTPVDEIRKLKRNLGCYPAFVAIRWGFAEIKGDVLVNTDKWDERLKYDEYGELLSSLGDKISEAKIDRVRERGFKEHSKPLSRRSVVSSSKPRRHQNTLSKNQLIKELIAFDAAPIIKRYQERDLKGKSPKQIISFSVNNTIYRAFHYETPSQRYARWRWHNDAETLLRTLNCIQTQKEFDVFGVEVGQSLVEDWGKTNDRGEPTRMNIGIAMKISNLVLKHLSFSEASSNPSLIKYLHVPWDSFTLTPLRTIWEGSPSIPRSPSQGFVKDLSMYHELHELISDVAEDAGVARIVYEFWAWDRAH